jgi:hypothetical protein
MLVSPVKLSTVLEDCTTEAQFCCVCFLWAKGLNEKDIHKEMFPVHGGKCLSRKVVHNLSRSSLKDVRKSQMVRDQVRKWLRQQSKDFYAVGFEAHAKRWDKCIDVGG